ncbi:DUF6916 family protein [Nocardioides rubriscoriae]|uniref:DUF6916 family protein n=1 Tax=Nocardioides rubriscoriae TaxID=642762 RepID=UPI0011DFF4A4|nr:hypothetical protein [Nocardioides rubriscoriae]
MSATDVDLTHPYLAQQAGRPVVLLDDGGRPVLGLDLAAPTAHRTSGGWESWSVELTGPAEPRLPQATYRVRFADGEEAWLFLVPSAADADTSTYLSTFTREAP